MRDNKKMIVKTHLKSGKSRKRITALKQREREEDYLNIIDNISDGIYCLNTEGHFTFVNKAITERSGIPAEQFHSLHFLDVISQEYHEQAKRNFQRIMKGEDEIVSELKYKNAVGQLRIVEVRSRPIRKDGKVVGLLGISRDITERTHAEEALKNQMEFVMTLLDTIPSPVFYKDVSGKYLGCNKAFEELLGRTREDIIGKSVHHMGRAEIAEKYEAMDNELFKRGGRQTYEWKVRAADGLEKDVIFNKAVFPDASGNIAGLVGVMVDITERKKTEKDLRESEAKYRELVENANSIILRMDNFGAVTFFNEFAQHFFGYKEEEILGKNVVGTIVPEMESTGRDLRWIIEDIGRHPNRYVNNINENMRRDGSRVWIAWTNKPIRDENGRVKEILCVGNDITERKQAEEKLREAHRRLDEIIEFLPDATFVIDADSKVIAWNKAMEQITGVPKAEMIGKGEYEYALPFYGERRPILIDLALLPDAEFEKRRYDIAQRSSDTIYGDVYVPKMYGGKGAYLYAAASRLRDAAGNIIGAIESIRDITKFKQAEEALRESEEKYRTIIENMQEGYHEVDIKGNFTFVNESTCKILGYEREELLGMNNRQYADEENNRKVYQVYNRVYRTGEQVKNFEWQIIRKDGERRDIEVSISLIRDMEGHPTGFRGVVRDTTDRKQAEEALRAEHERLTSILDGIPVPTFVIDRDRRVLIWNSNNEVYTGIAKEEVLGKSLDLSFLFREKVSPTLAELILENGDEELIARFGRRGLRKSEFQPHAFESAGRIWIKGEEKIVITQAARIIDVNGHVVGAIQTAQDITHSTQLEVQLRQAQKMEAIGTLAGGIAHDFNNILSAVLGYTEMALEEPKINDRLRRCLDQVFKAGERARDLVKQILAFSRQIDERPRPLRVSPITKEVLKLLRASLPTTIKIRQDIQYEDDMVLADPTQIHQILMNLCTNAAHSMRGTQGELKVSLVPVSLEPSDDLIIHHDLSPGKYLRLTVSDTGAGIDNEIIGRIFDPFFTTKKPGEGTGLGLSVVHGIVKSYGGTITVQSEVGKGTDFNVYLPLLTEVEDKQEAKVEAPIPDGKERILFVDDEAALVQLARSTLSDLGYEVTGRTNSLEALNLFRARPDRFDLVITDMTMPNMTGGELAQQLIRIRPDIPVILCTGFSEAITREKARAIGVREFIMKPIVKRQIAEAIRRSIDKEE